MTVSSPSALWQHDLQALDTYPSLIGVDEAGRGALAGPVVAAAVWCPASFYQNHAIATTAQAIHDSKQLKASQREALAEYILSWHRQGLIRVAYASADVTEIEEHNILGATRIAMQRALEGLAIPLQTTEDDLPLFTNEASANNHPQLLVDGKPLRPFPYRHQHLISGDARSFCIASASIIAKVQRDAVMQTLHLQFPSYEFARHKGYGTEAHYQALRLHGASKVHRPSFLKKFTIALDG